MSDVTTPTGALTTLDGRRRRLVFRRVLADPVDAVWSAATESDRLGRWFGTYTGTGRVGGTVELLMTAASTLSGPGIGAAPRHGARVVRPRRTPQRAKSGWSYSPAPVGLGVWGD
jgi:uncharacterized protein YndB with AHSA1/START domain